MSRVLCPDTQQHLFSPDVMKAIASHPRVDDPMPELPPANKEIDVPRACIILATKKNTVHRLIAAGLIKAYAVNLGDVDPPKRILYDSVVGFCDNLRAKYLIPPRKQTARGTRPRDEDILPFPMRETISLLDVANALRISVASAVKRIECGDLVAYKLLDEARSRWRVHRPSLAAYIQRLRAQIE